MCNYRISCLFYILECCIRIYFTVTANDLHTRVTFTSVNHALSRHLSCKQVLRWMQLFIAFLHVEDHLVILHHNLIACIYAVGGGLCGLMLYRSGFVEFIGLCGAGCHFSYNPFVADPTFFLIHRYEAIAGEVIFLARWSGSVTESALQGISEKKFGIPLFFDNGRKKRKAARFFVAE